MSQKYSGQLTTAKEICDSTGAPFDATARVMQIMAQKGLLKSEQGAHGGYLLVKDLARVSLYDLMEMILGPLNLVKCLHQKEKCDLIGSCNIQSPLQAFNHKLSEFYRELSLTEILQIKEGRAGIQGVAEKAT